MTELLEAVDALTLETHTLVPQWFTHRGPMCTSRCPKGREHSHTARVVHDSLLHQLEAAIASTIGAGAGRAMTEKWALSVLDSGALQQFAQIESQIRDWCRMAGIEATRHPVDNLRAWYVTRLAMRDDESEEGDAAATKILRKWASTIRAKMDPPKTIELTSPCPKCHAATYEDEDGTTLTHPIRIQYRDHEADILATAWATCRACGEEWRGSAALREMRWDVDAAEAATERPDLPREYAGNEGLTL